MGFLASTCRPTSRLSSQPRSSACGRWSDRPAGSFRTCSHTSPAGSGGSVLGTSERRGQPRGRRGRCGAPASRLSANGRPPRRPPGRGAEADGHNFGHNRPRSEEHTSELQSPDHLVCRLLLEKKKKKKQKLLNEIHKKKC